MKNQRQLSEKGCSFLTKCQRSIPALANKAGRILVLHSSGIRRQGTMPELTLGTGEGSLESYIRLGLYILLIQSKVTILHSIC